MNRPPDARCRSFAVYAVTIGVRGERDGDAGSELDALGVLGRDRERQERIVRGLGRQQPVVADVFERLRPRADLGQRRRHDPGVDLHARETYPGSATMTEGVTGRLYRRRMASDIELDSAQGRALHPPHHLSPSSMGTFTSCPLVVPVLLPGAPAGDADRAGLQGDARPPGAAAPHVAARRRAHDRGRARGSGPGPGRARGRSEFAQLELTDEQWAEFHAEAEVLVRRYFEMEDPRTVQVLGVELRVSATTEDGVIIRGIIDRLELDADGELVVTDYKTGSAPGEGWEQRSMAGVHVYSLLCEKMFGRRPARVQLLYLSGPEKIVTRATDQSLRGVEVKSNAVMRAIRVACTRHDFRPRASALCAFCSFREFCPEFGGDPSHAAPVLQARQAEREGRPQLPLAIV